jgi:hypothetical protein
MVAHHERLAFPRSRCQAFTLVELLISTVVIMVLVGLLLPGLHWVRESTRALGCRNHVRVLASAVIRHEAAQNFLPVAGRYGGSGGEFTGDPDLGFGQELNGSTGQWGSWLYTILPYMGRLELWEFGIGESAVYPASHARRIEIAVAPFNCPSRGNPFLDNDRGYRNSGFTRKKARTDFASARSASGAAALDTPGWQSLGRRVTEITDGIGNVFLCGERYIAPRHYNGASAANNWDVLGWNDGGWTAGNDWDTSSRVDLMPIKDSAAPPPVIGNVVWYFGGPHGAVHMAMCDGSVRAVDFSISPALFRSLGIINDGLGTVQDVID